MSYYIKPTDVGKIADNFVNEIVLNLQSVTTLFKVKAIDDSDVQLMKQEAREILSKLYLYATAADKTPYSDEEAMIVCEQISDVAWNRSVSPYQKKIFWNTWLNSDLGKIVRMAIARKKFRNKEPLNALDLSLISMTTPANISNLINRGVIEAEKGNQDREWIITSEEAERYLSTSRRS